MRIKTLPLLVLLFCIPAMVVAAAGKDRLNAGESLQVGQSIISPDGKSTMTLSSYQGNGYLTLSMNCPDGGTNNWSVPAYGSPALGAISRAVMQADGNFVLLNAQGVSLWSTNTHSPGAYLVIQNGGSLMILLGDKLLWSQTVGRCD